MVQILPEAPSFGQQLARGLGSGLGQGVSQASQIAIKLMGERRKELKKNMSDIDSFIHKKLKDQGYKSWLENPKKKAALKEIYAPLIAEGADPNEAFEVALAQHQGVGKKGSEKTPAGDEEVSNAPSISQGIKGTNPFVPPWLADFLTKERGNIDPVTREDISEGKHPGRPDIALKSLPAGIAGAVETGAGFGVPGLLASLAQRKSQPTTVEDLLGKKTNIRSTMDILTGKNLPEKPTERYFRLPSEMIAEKLMEGMNPEERKKAQESIEAQSFGLGAGVPALEAQAGKFIKGRFAPKATVQPGGEGVAKAASSAEEGLGAKATGEVHDPTKYDLDQFGNEVYRGNLKGQIRREAGTFPIGKKEAKPSLQGRVSKEIAENPTDMRIERTQPETRVYNRLDNVKLREQQVKLFPQYESEISADAAARSAREEARRPKTALGEASQAARMTEAESQLPAVRKAYENSVGRVRALEDEVSRLTGTQRETADTLLQLAQRDLENAEFEMIQTLNNARTGERRVGIPQMEKAAQEKMTKIADQIAAGEEIKLAKMDYNPEHLAEANRISKSKKLPARRTDDFYTRVHDTYANQYKSRLAQIENEIQAAMKDKSLSSLYQRQQLAKEKEALNKMIKSAEAENAIHRHKIGLREIANRHRAQERFARLRKAEGGEKTAQVAREKMWKERIQEAKSPEERAKVFEEATEQAAHENPKAEEQIRKEGAGLHEAFEKVEEEAAKAKAGKAKNAKSAEEAASETKKFFDRFLNSVKDLKTNFPFIWRTKVGRDLLKGAATAVFDETMDYFDVDLPFGTSTALSIIWGNPRRSGWRLLGNAIPKLGIREWKLHHAKKAYEGTSAEDEEKFSSYSPRIRKKAMELSLGI